MKKLRKRVEICCLIALTVWGTTLISERKQLRDNLIRLHVVANSDSYNDQQLKLQVKDAIVESMKAELQQCSDISQARQYLQENLPRIQQTANAVLKMAGVNHETVVTLCRETFDTRYYDTFALPAGIYESLRIVIGDGNGRNWWCVAFPTLCLPTSRDEFETTAVGAGFSNALSNTLAGEEGYEVRFFVLDQFGRLENIFFGG